MERASQSQRKGAGKQNPCKSGSTQCRSEEKRMSLPPDVKGPAYEVKGKRHTYFRAQEAGQSKDSDVVLQ